MAGLSVIAIGGGEQGRRVRSLAETWTANGLLQESVWVMPDDVVVQPSGPPRVAASVITAAGVHTDDLFRVVGVRRLDLLRLVVVHLIPQAEGIDELLVATATTLADLFASVLPRSTTEGGVVGTRLHRVNLLVPDSGTVGVPTAALQQGWDVNAILSAEDRPDLDRASIFVRHPGNYEGHALAGMAAVAAMWSGVDEGCLDHHEGNSFSAERSVVVVRPSVKAVVGDDLVRKMTDAAATAIHAEPAGPARLLDWARPARDPRGTARRATTEIQALGDWVPVIAHHGSNPLRSERKVKVAISDAARFNAQLFGVASGWLVSAGRRALEHVATGVIVGHDGAAVVRLEPRTPNQIMRQANARLEAQSTHLRNGLLVQDASAVPSPTPATWPTLRQACFSLADGSTPPSGVHVPEMAGVRELLPPMNVAPDPTDTFVTSEGRLLRSGDVVSARRYRGELATRVAEAQTAAKATVVVVSAVSVSTETTCCSRHAEATTAGAVDREGEATPHADDCSTRKVDTAPPTGAELLVMELEDLDRWIARREDAVLWQLTENVTDRAGASRSQAEAAYKEATSGGAPNVEALRGAQTTLMDRWKVLAVLFVLLVLLSVGVFQTRPPGADEILIGLAVSGTLIFILTVLSNHAYYRAALAFEWSVQKLLDRRRRAASAYVADKQEAGRLELLTVALLDWSEIIGWVLHHPWGPQTQAGRVVSNEALATFPASVGIATPTEETADLPTRFVVAAAGVLCTPSWSSNLFDQVVELNKPFGDDEETSGHLAADIDLLDSAGSPRRQLVEELATGKAQVQLAEAAHAALQAAYLGGTLELPPRIVLRRGQYGDEIPVLDGTFFQGAVGPVIPFVDDAWTPRGLQSGKNLPEISRMCVPKIARTSAPAGTPEASGDVALRVDISRVCEPEDLRYFAPDAGRANVPARNGNAADWY